MKKHPLLFVCMLVLVGGVALADESKEDKAYLPGLGEMMNGQIQPRHLKIWFAGQNSNWQLTKYEILELKEALEDIEHYQPNWRGYPIAEMMETMMGPSLEKLEKAVDQKDGIAFQHAYQDLTESCNSCHKAIDRLFIVIDIPTSNPFSNQKFGVQKEKGASGH